MWDLQQIQTHIQDTVKLEIIEHGYGYIYIYVLTYLVIRKNPEKYL